MSILNFLSVCSLVRVNPPEQLFLKLNAQDEQDENDNDDHGHKDERIIKPTA